MGCVYQLATILFLVVFQFMAAATEVSVRQKLSGPVKDFISKSYNFYRTPFSANSSKYISYVKIKGSNKNHSPLVIIPGRGSHAFFWAETIFDFKSLGYDGDIYIWDAPGQGQSDRLFEGNDLVVEVSDFSDYNQSFIEFLKILKLSHEQQKIKILGHSMGGAIALNAAENHSELIESMVVLAPMLDIRFGHVLVDTLLTKLAVFLGQFTYFRGMVFGADSPREVLAKALDPARNDRIRFCWEMEDRYNVRMPGQTLGWVAQAIRGGEMAIANAHKVDVPVKVYIAEDDFILDNEGTKTFVEKCGKNCSLEIIPKGLHAVVEDSDAVRDPIVKNLWDWASDRSHL